MCKSEITIVVIICLQPRNDISENPSCGAKYWKRPVMFIWKRPAIVIVALGLLLFLVLGAMAVGGVALHYAHEYFTVILHSGSCVTETTN